MKIKDVWDGLDEISKNDPNFKLTDDLIFVGEDIIDEYNQYHRIDEKGIEEYKKNYKFLFKILRENTILNLSDEKVVIIINYMLNVCRNCYNEWEENCYCIDQDDYIEKE